ncbi:MAG TPA: Holliday junction branch migration protein RuvA [Steroidobacteraceae bacterium]|jgi:Holliday junction DNA helicase RuvA|nr:Holliday junction branch migration protein RuvA [Steroidobacteraceae bacterium]
MIGSLSGVLVVKSPPHLLLEVGGVGYELEAPMSTFFVLPEVGERARLLTHLQVREDAHVLYGFSTAAERTLFRNLLKVSGVGPRIALAILSGVSAASFAEAVRNEDSAMLTRIPGVGRKIAERLIVEMRDRIESESAFSVAGMATPSTGIPLPIMGGGAQREAFSALVAFFGYKPAEASRLLKAVEPDSGSLSTEEWIRRALQSAVRA